MSFLPFDASGGFRRADTNPATGSSIRILRRFDPRAWQSCRISRQRADRICADAKL